MMKTTRFEAGRRVLWAVVGTIAVLTPTLLAAGSAPATPSQGVSRSDLGRGTMRHGHDVTIAEGSDVVAQSITLAGGGSTGWHTHPGNTIEIVTSGTITILYAADPNCAARTFSAGQAFGITGGDVHLAYNDGTAPAEFVTMDTGVAPGGSNRAEAERPAHCSDR